MSVEININDKPVRMEVDHRSDAHNITCTSKLRTVDAEYHSRTTRAELVIVDGDGPTLRHFRIDQAKLHKINPQHNSKLEELLSKHAISSQDWVKL